MSLHTLCASSGLSSTSRPMKMQLLLFIVAAVSQPVHSAVVPSIEAQSSLFIDARDDETRFQAGGTHIVNSGKASRAGCACFGARLGEWRDA